ncbi:MAG: alpha/beta hydrolase [Acidimicrobiales bacterium]|nr:alpha/beta hydrolase [Acidimicrobiales bacterium]
MAEPTRTPSATARRRPVSRTIDVDGPVHVADYGGPDDGPLLVAVHGLGGSHLDWLAVGPLLTRRSRLVAVDLLGHGRTPAAGRTPDMDGHRHVLDGVLRELASGPVVLVGNSMGGLVCALEAADRPAAVAGLVLVDPAIPAMGGPGIVHPRVLGNLLVCSIPGLGERFVDVWRRRTPARRSVEQTLRFCCVDAGRVPAEVVDALVELKAGVDRRSAELAYLRSVRSLTSTMLRPATMARALDASDRPVLLLHGDRDWLVPVGVARRLCATRPNWELVEARGVGHIPMLEVPELTADAVDTWLEGAGASAAAISRGTRTGRYRSASTHPSPAL